MSQPFETELAGLRTLAADLASTWRDKANCLNADPNLFFDDEEPRGVQRENRRTVRALCAVCPVIAHCATFGVAQEGGRWAGYRPNTLRDMRGGEKPGWSELMAGRLPTRNNGGTDNE